MQVFERLSYLRKRVCYRQTPLILCLIYKYFASARRREGDELESRPNTAS